MSKYRINADKTNRLDYCPHCEEIWLDDGEWQLVEGLVLAGDFTKVFTQAWQYAVRSGVTSAMEEQRLREIAGQRLRTCRAICRVAADAARRSRKSWRGSCRRK